MDPLINITGLTHKYGEHVALDNLTFSVNSGEIIGLLGPNGAGKTTTIRLINGLLEPFAGSIRVFNLDPLADGEEIRKKTGVLTETPALYERLTARQNLTFFGTLAGMQDDQLNRRIPELLSFFELENRADDRVGTYSKGMKQRLALARAILHSPEIIFLDEPTSGLDPEAALRVHQLISNISQINKQTVLLCTHNLNEAQLLCDRLIILEKGHLLANGTLEQLREKLFPEIRLSIGFIANAQSFMPIIASFDNITNIEVIKENAIKMHVSTLDTIPGLVKTLINSDAQITSVVQEEITLDEIYFHLQHEGEPSV